MNFDEKCVKNVMRSREKKKKIEKSEKSLRHPVFPDGHPFKY